MSELIQRWIEERLGVLLNMTPEVFAEKVKDGYLLSTILKGYGIITDDQLNMIEKSTSPEICMSNFKNHILTWLKIAGILVDDAELFNIANSKGTAALNLFYQIYLVLQAKDNLNFVAQQRLKEKLRPKTDRFKVQRVPESKKSDEEPKGKQFDMALRDAHGIIHWQKDRMQMLQTKCKEAREEYVLYTRARNSLGPKFSNSASKMAKVDPPVPNIEEDSVNLTYDELVQQQTDAKRSLIFVPDVQESKKLLKKYQTKQKEIAKNLVFKSELQRDIFTHVWKDIEKEEDDRFNDNLIEAILKQSLYEEQIHKKIGSVKLQKHIMLEKKREEAEALSKQMEQDFAQKIIINDKEIDERELTYYLEKERLRELHEKLYQQKQRIKNEKNHNMVLQTVHDIVNLSFNLGDYVRHIGEEPSRRLKDKWKKMFIAGIPFESYITPVETILQKPEDITTDIEEIVHLEIDRQDKLDKSDLDSYMAFEWPWLLDNIELEENSLNDMICSLNILGNIVHNLLLAKYPPLPLPPKPDFPDITVSACVNGLDTTFLPVLGQILLLKKILVVQVQDCINYCVRAYIEETEVRSKQNLEHPDQENSNSNNNEDKIEKKKRKGAKEKLKTIKKKEEELAAVKPQFEDKMVQTSSYCPEEDAPLSTKAELGKVARDVLESGESLTSHIIAAMFVEYIKSKPNITGWALINYPNTLEEAAALEEALTGLPVSRTEVGVCQSIMDIIVELEQKPPLYTDIDANQHLRVSKILPQPVALQDPEFYDTALTAYIKVLKKEKTGEQEKRKRDSLPSSIESEDDDDDDALDQFYADLGCNYHFYYNRIDLPAIKYLAKLIVGDYSIPRKTSVELFGEEIKYINYAEDIEPEPPFGKKKGEKKEKPKEKKKKGKESKGETVNLKHSEHYVDVAESKKSVSKRSKTKVKEKKGKKTKEQIPVVVIVHEDKYTQAPEPEEVEEEEPETEPEVVELPKPGEADWVYIKFPIPENLQVALATLWENAEEIYLVDLQQVFFLKRVILNAVMPFVSSVRDHMTTYMDRPDEKQKYLREFQKAYNEFENDIRGEDDFKAEMHCRVSEMKEKLVEICDWKMIAADHERVFLIVKNWTPRELIQFLNIYITAFQLEIDRYADTIILLSDYYTAITTKTPSEEVILKELLPKLETEDPQITQAINQMLQYVDNTEDDTLHNFTEYVFQKAQNFVDSINKTAHISMNKIRDILGSSESVMSPSKDKRTTKCVKGKELELDECLFDMASNILDEWECALRGEIVRVKVRINLLKNDLIMNLDEALTTIRTVFHTVYHNIRDMHEKELKSINTVCNLLALATEKEMKIQEELILDQIRFSIDPEIILFPDTLPLVKPLEESVRTGTFKINQLDKLVDIFLDLSPSGYMPERSFSFLLQDLIVNYDEPILVPDLWRKLQPRDVDKLSKCLFDDVEYIQWKDFILYILLAKFPAENELLKLREAFRVLDPDSTELITDYQYIDIKFWFEDDEEDKYRLKLMREVIYKMYRVKMDQMNYTALLLDLCKDDDPLVGLSKAMTVSMGKLICRDIETGENFLEMTKRINEEIMAQNQPQHQESEKLVNTLITEILGNISLICMTPKEDGEKDIESVPDESEQPEEEQVPEEEPAENVENWETVADLAYFLPLEVLLTVITTCLPWHARVQNIGDKSFRELIEDVYEDCKKKEFDYEVLSHEFINHPRLKELVGNVNKFSIKNTVLIVEDILQDKVTAQESMKLKTLS